MAFTTQEKQAWKEQQQAEQKRLLEDAVDQLTDSAAWEHWVKFGRNNLHRLSFQNALLIWSQKRDATVVWGKKQWEKQGVSLNEDARSIRYFAPIMGQLYIDGDPQFDDNDKPVMRLKFYKTVEGYDVQDTNAPESSFKALLPVEGDDLIDYLAPLESFAREMGWLVRYREDTGTALGWADFQNTEIVVNKSGSANSIVRILVHELAHVYGDINYKDYSREDAEVMVESAVVMALGLIGFDVKESSVPYIAEWGNGDLSALKKYAATVDDLVNELTEKMGI